MEKGENSSSQRFLLSQNAFILPTGVFWGFHGSILGQDTSEVSTCETKEIHKYMSCCCDIRVLVWQFFLGVLGTRLLWLWESWIKNLESLLYKFKYFGLQMLFSTLRQHKQLLEVWSKSWITSQPLSYIMKVRNNYNFWKKQNVSFSNNISLLLKRITS